MFTGACSGLVFGGVNAATLSVPGITPTLRAPGYLGRYFFQCAKLKNNFLAPKINSYAAALAKVRKH